MTVPKCSFVNINELLRADIAMTSEDGGYLGKRLIKRIMDWAWFAAQKGLWRKV